MRVLRSLRWFNLGRSSCLKSTKMIGEFTIHFQNQLLIIAERGERLSESKEMFRTIVTLE